MIGVEEPLFGKTLTEEEAEAMVSHGKLTTQAKNCMGCHTLLGNGSYYAPDLTKSWLDQGWGSKQAREQAMVDFLMHPELAAHNSLGRKMPNLGITEDEARATVAFLKWMSSFDTNGFPANFKPIDQSDAPAAAPVAESAAPVADPAASAGVSPATQQEGE